MAAYSNELNLLINGKECKIQRVQIISGEGTLINPGSYFSSAFPINCFIQQTIDNMFIPLSFHSDSLRVYAYPNNRTIGDLCLSDKYSTLEEAINSF